MCYLATQDKQSQYWMMKLKKKDKKDIIISNLTRQTRDMGNETKITL